MLNRHPIVASREAIPVRRFFLNQHGLLAFRHTHCPLYAVGVRSLQPLPPDAETVLQPRTHELPDFLVDAMDSLFSNNNP